MKNKKIFTAPYRTFCYIIIYYVSYYLLLIMYVIQYLLFVTFLIKKFLNNTMQACICLFNDIGNDENEQLIINFILYIVAHMYCNQCLIKDSSIEAKEFPAEKVKISQKFLQSCSFSERDVTNFIFGSRGTISNEYYFRREN